VEYALSAQAVGKQLKLADARKAKLAVVVGPDEWARGEVMMKDLRSGSQESIQANSLVNAIKARTNG
jgi:histidyl-tRNA synthetase